MPTAPLLRALPAVGLLLWAFAPTLQFLLDKWSTDPQYSHGFLVPAFSLYLLWQRHKAGGEWTSTPWPWLGGLTLAAALLMRVTAGGLLFHQLDAAAFLLSLGGVCLAAGGRSLAVRAAPAIAFLIFAVPLPFELERGVGGPLRTAATVASTFLLQTLGLPAIAEGNTILIDDVRLGVVEACSGLKMLMTFAAFSVGAVLLAGRSWFERGMVLLGIVPIAVLVNVLRITATGVTHTITSGKAANAAAHDVYGWLMMPAGLALLGLELWVLGRLVISNPNSAGGAR